MRSRPGPLPAVEVLQAPRSSTSTGDSAISCWPRWATTRWSPHRLRCPGSGLHGARDPDRRARPAPSVPPGRPRVTSCRLAGVRTRPAAPSRRRLVGGGPPAAVAEPRSGVPVRLRTRGLKAIGASRSPVVGSAYPQTGRQSRGRKRPYSPDRPVLEARMMIDHWPRQVSLGPGGGLEEADFQRLALDRDWTEPGGLSTSSESVLTVSLLFVVEVAPSGGLGRSAQPTYGRAGARSQVRSASRRRAIALERHV